MKIELKNLVVNLRFSEETNMFKANVYVNGKKVAYACNDGRGGNTSYQPFENMQGELKLAEEYAKSLPPVIHSNISIPMDLEFFIDELVSKELEKRDSNRLAKKIEKLCLNHIVWGKRGDEVLNTIGFSKKPMFSEVTRTEVGKEALRKLFNRIKSELKEGEEIFNQNLDF